MSEAAILEKAKAIKLLICDVDGVMTDGRLIYTEQGHTVKNFHVHDGFGLKLLQHSGVEVAVITACRTGIVKRRMQDIGIEHAFYGQFNKAQAYHNLVKKLGFDYSQVACLGDDLPDIPMIEHSGLGCAVANAVPRVKACANWVTTKPGGHGAVRELCELIMEAQQSHDAAFARYQSL